MVTIRRWYIFLVCAISLQTATWAAINLLSNLLTLGARAPVESIAFQIAVILVGVPIFLVHWLWAQRLASRDAEERASTVRRFYLYGMLAGFLAPFISNAFDLVASILQQPFNGWNYPWVSPLNGRIGNLCAMVILGLMWFYHRRILEADARSTPITGNGATIRRFYLYSFSAAGVTMVTMGSIQLLRWVFFQFGDTLNVRNTLGLTDEVARLVVGLALWLIFWNSAQRLFYGPSEEEHESALRKFYLYAIVFVAVIGTVTYTTTILAGFLRRLMSLPATGDIRIPLSTIICSAVLWAYHAYILRKDTEQVMEAPRQAAIRRLYLYLVAAVGLAAFLVGTGGVISVLIRSLAGDIFGSTLKEQLAWFSAALIAGLPVWLLPWRHVQSEATALTSRGVEERHSVIRKLYLYFFIFAATMTVLSSAVYILYQLLSLLLGASIPGNLLSNLGQSIAFLLIGLGVWLYHGYALRTDGKLNRQEQTSRLTDLSVVLVDPGDGGFMRQVFDGLQREMPQLPLELIPLPSPQSSAGEKPDSMQAKLAGARLIVGPWTMAAPGVHNGMVAPEIACAVVDSPAQKLLVPLRTEGWEWAGVDPWNPDALVEQTIRSVKQLVEGEKVRPVRPMGAGAIAGVVVGVFLLLLLLYGIMSMVYVFFSGSGF